MSARELRAARALATVAHAGVALGVLLPLGGGARATVLALALGAAVLQGWLSRVEDTAPAPGTSRDGTRPVPRRRALAPWVLGLAVVAGMLLEVGPGALVLLVQASALGLAWAMPARTGRTTLLALLAPVCAVLVLAVQPSLPAVLSLPLGALAALWAWLLSMGASTRPAPAAGPRLAPALALLALLLLPTTGLYLAISALGRRTGPLAEPPARGLEAPATDTDAGGRSGTRSPRGGRPAEVFGSDLALSGGVNALSGAELMRVRVRGPEGAAGAEPPPPLHLRCVVMDEIDGRGVRSGGGLRPRLLRDAEDGARDGWCEVLPAPPGGSVRELEIEMRCLGLEDRPWSALFAPEPLLAVELDTIAYDPDGVLVWPDQRIGYLTYGTRSWVRDLTSADLAGRRAHHPDPRWTRVGGDPGQLERIDRALAPALSPAGGGARDDRARVLALGRLLRARCTYERAAQGFEGLPAVAAFLERRRGHCTHFATAMVVGLRRAGIASRVVTGVLAREWSEEPGEFVVRERDAHAWVEVHFEGLGWLTFDPTPAALEDDGEAPLGSDLEDGGALGWTEVWADFLAGDPQGLERLLLHGLASGAAPWVVGGLVGLLLLRALGLRRGRRRGDGADPADGGPPAGAGPDGERPEPGPDPLRELWERLAREGLERRPEETVRRFLVRVAGHHPGASRELRGATEWAYAVRWGAAPGTTREPAPRWPRMPDLLRVLGDAPEPGGETPPRRLP